MPRFLLILLSSLQFLLAKECVFDKKYAVEITKCHGTVSPPSIYDYYYQDYWTANVYIDFGNGLCGVKKLRAKHESHAKQYAAFTYQGPVNILLSEYGDFSLLENDSKYPTKLDSLWVRKYHDVGAFPVIQCVREEIEVQTSWLFDDTYVYHYSIELSDGTTWRIQPQSKPIESPWNFGDKIALVGSSDSPCLINISATLARDSYTIVYLRALSP